MSSEHPIPGTAFEKTIVLPGFDPPRAPPKPIAPAQQMRLLKADVVSPRRVEPAHSSHADVARHPIGVQLTIALPGDQLTMPGC